MFLSVLCAAEQSTFSLMKVAKIEQLVLLAHITSCLTSHQTSSWTENTPDVSGDKLNLGITQLETYAFSMGVILPQGGKLWQNKREHETAIYYCIINSVILGIMHKFLSDINLYSFYVQILHKQMGYILYIQYYSSVGFPSQPLGYYKKHNRKWQALVRMWGRRENPCARLVGMSECQGHSRCGETVRKFLKHLKIESASDSEIPILDAARGLKASS